MSVPNYTIVVDRYIQPTLSAARHSLLEYTSQLSTAFEATNTDYPNIYTLSSFATGNIVLSSLSSMGCHTSPILTKPTVLYHTAFSSPLTTTSSEAVAARVASAKTGAWKLFSP